MNQSGTNQDQSNSLKLKDLNIYVGSWNVAGKEFKEDFSLIKWLFPKEAMKIPDIFVLGFQEICNLNAKNIMISSNSDKVDTWKNIIKNNINQIGKFALVKCLDLVGLLIIIFIKDNLCEFVKNIETAILRTGLYGALGNKGSCLIRFNIQETSFVFCCSHLKAGTSNANANSRFSEISEIMNKNFTIKNYGEMKFKEHDVQFIFGDLNFRIDTDLQNCMAFIKSGYYENLFLFDQLNKQKSIKLELMELEELPIKFPPTYKYLENLNEYDLIKKRIPSWCDRILFNNSNKIKGFDYNHVDYFKESDHKPIYGLYNIKINETGYCNENKKTHFNFMGNSNNNIDNIPIDVNKYEY